MFVYITRTFLNRNSLATQDTPSESHVLLHWDEPRKLIHPFLTELAVPHDEELPRKELPLMMLLLRRSDKAAIVR